MKNSRIEIFKTSNKEEIIPIEDLRKSQISKNFT